MTAHPDPRRPGASIRRAEPTASPTSTCRTARSRRWAATSARPDGARIIDASGKVVAPGLIDLHVHLREPGQEHAGDDRDRRDGRGGGRLHRGVRHAQHRSGHRQPGDGRDSCVRQAIRAGKARVYPIGAVSLGQRGEQLTEFGEMVGPARSR